MLFFSCSVYEIKYQKDVMKRSFPIAKKKNMYTLYIFREFTRMAEVPSAEVVVNGNVVCSLRQAHSCVIEKNDTSAITFSVIQNKKPKVFSIIPRLGEVDYLKFIMRNHSDSFWVDSPVFLFIPSTLEEASSTTNDNYFEVIPQQFIPGDK